MQDWDFDPFRIANPTPNACFSIFFQAAQVTTQPEQHCQAQVSSKLC